MARASRARVIELNKRYFQERAQAFLDLSRASLLCVIRELGYVTAATPR
jgi:hypothetical protein